MRSAKRASPSTQSLSLSVLPFLSFSQCFPSCTLWNLLFLIQVKLAHLDTQPHTRVDSSPCGGGGRHDLSRLQAHLPFHLSLRFHFTYDLLLQQIPPMALEIDLPIYCLCWLVFVWVLLDECVCVCVAQRCLKHSSEVAVAGLSETVNNSGPWMFLPKRFSKGTCDWNASLDAPKHKLDSILCCITFSLFSYW